MESVEDPDLIQSPPEPEAFIPFLMDDLVEMCLEDGKLPTAEREQFRQFCDFFAVTTNFLSHREMDSLDKDYAYFNPDCEFKIRPCGKKKLKEAEKRVVNAFKEAAQNANYRKLSDTEIEASFESQSLIKLRTRLILTSSLTSSVSFAVVMCERSSVGIGNCRRSMNRLKSGDACCS